MMMMIGAVQLGLLAAIVVVLVPMGMAGYHLSRNKMLFFGGALFITLAVGVHLTPYFPSSVNDLVSSVVVFDRRRISCLSRLHDVVWDVVPSSDLNRSITYHKSWAWDPSASASSCGFQKLARFEAADLLNGSWVVVAGDSQARLLAVSLLGLVLDSGRMEQVRTDLYKKHSDYEIVVGEIEMRLDFIWAPYAVNLTSFVEGLKGNGYYPDVLVMGGGLWHMLHFTNASHYGVSLQELRNHSVSLFPPSSPPDGEGGGRRTHLFWIGMPTLINSMLNTEGKRERMTDSLRAAYDEQLRKSGLLGPLFLLDVESLSWNCGVKCTVDGMHYDIAVYQAAMQIMLNALLIHSHQKL